MTEVPVWSGWLVLGGYAVALVVVCGAYALWARSR